MKQLFFIVIALFVLVSCKKDKTEPVPVVNPIVVTDPEECILYKVAYVTNVDAPITGIVNTPIQIDVNYSYSDGCGESSKFIETVNGKTMTIEVEGKYIGCSCTQSEIPATSPYEFLATTSGVYTLKFKSGNADYIEMDLEITE